MPTTAAPITSAAPKFVNTARWVARWNAIHSAAVAAPMAISTEATKSNGSYWIAGKRRIEASPV